MLKFLHVRNLATIEDIELSLETGFSILTGETGAGKSIIIDSIRLLLGDKAPTDLIRTGKTEATVEAVFAFDQGTPPGLESLVQDSEITLNRQITDQGTGKAYAGGVLVPVKKLKEWSPWLVDIYGQNDHIFLLHLENHLNYIDHYGETMPLRDEVSGLAQSLRKLIREKKDLEFRQRDAAQRLDFLGYQIREIEEAALRPEEEEELHKERRILKHAEKIAGLVESALEIAYSQEQSLTTQAGQLENILGELSSFDAAFEVSKKTLEDVSITLKELADSLLRYREKQALAPDRLEAVEERLSLIERLKRKYGTDIRDIGYYHDKIRAERDSLATSQERLESLAREIEATLAAYRSRAEELTRRRTQASRTLEREIEKEIALLGMKNARFAVALTQMVPDASDSDKIRDSGQDDVEFLISPNPGEQLRPLRKIASGGELSRIMLALKAVGKEKEGLKTLVFDEIDAGIGGKTAEFIAQKLRDLGRRHQVLCITHLPQIASFAVHHYRIDKHVEKERTFTTVARLDFEGRIKEIARLISGVHLTPTSLQHAREMLTQNLEGRQSSGASHAGRRA
jgi:DNA repair protein RecN (Recombination protein N)